MANQYEIIYKKLTDQDKEDIVRLKVMNMASMKSNTYNNHALQSFYDFWKVHFPGINQSINCEGCRKTVTKFYHGLADFIKEYQNNQKEIVAKKSIKTKSKTKKSKVNV